MEPCIRLEVQIPQGDGAVFRGCTALSKALRIFAAAVAVAFAVKGAFNGQ